MTDGATPRLPNADRAIVEERRLQMGDGAPRLLTATPL